MKKKKKKVSITINDRKNENVNRNNYILCAHKHVKQLCNKYDSRCTELSKLVRYMMIALSWKSSYVEINHRIINKNKFVRFI